ncbi:MAG TPA: class 1 fructose-bisphosphatase [Candidatus Sulfotelmatobacter sp.]|nr:class 1 fructose-bisphosphatase [Candidatus Sulfotelmatobacter sp.]
MIPGRTLPQHILFAQQAHPEARGGFSRLLTHIGLASKVIARELRRAALAGTLGRAGTVNVQGEHVQKLDILANEIVVDALRKTRLVCTMVSEEMDEPLHLPEACSEARYVVCFDPLDGSSNIDVNGVVGTIFSIRRRRDGGPDHVMADVLGPGTEQVAAGYVMYGPSTVFVYTAGDGVHGFTLDTSIGEYLLSHEWIRIPAKGKTYSINEGNFHRWHPHTRRLVEHLRAADKPSGRPYSLRYVGSLVADLHRTLLEGGLFLYPEDASQPRGTGGKLRLLYEVAPVSLVVEQAGGRASTGQERILDIRPTSPHQRVPVIFGSPEDVALAERFHQERQ